VAAGCAYFSASSGVCHTMALGLKEGSDLPLGFLMAMLLPHLVAEAGAVNPERVGTLLYPMAGTDTFALTATDFKSLRTIALLWEFFDAINSRLETKIPLSLGDAGLTEEQINRVRSGSGEGAVNDYLISIINGARRGLPCREGDAHPEHFSRMP
jgi:alcohol dehydrogenase class IV